VTRPSYGRAETLGLDHIAELAAEGVRERDAVPTGGRSRAGPRYGLVAS
jgi:hypothetical protein